MGNVQVDRQRKPVGQGVERGGEAAKVRIAGWMPAAISRRPSMPLRASESAPLNGLPGSLRRG